MLLIVFLCTAVSLCGFVGLAFALGILIGIMVQDLGS